MEIALKKKINKHQQKDPEKPKRNFYNEKPLLEEYKSDMNQAKQKEIELETKTIVQPDSLQNWIDFVLFQLEKNGLQKGLDSVNQAIFKMPQNKIKEKTQLYLMKANIVFNYANEQEMISFIDSVKNTVYEERVIIHLRELCFNENNFKLAEQLTKQLEKVIKEKIKVWLFWTELLIKKRQFEKDNKEIHEVNLKEILRRAKQSLEVNKESEFQIEYIKQEYKFGDFEIGRVQFEKIILENPRKNLIWQNNKEFVY